MPLLRRSRAQIPPSFAEGFGFFHHGGCVHSLGLVEDILLLTDMCNNSLQPEDAVPWHGPTKSATRSSLGAASKGGSETARHCESPGAKLRPAADPTTSL